MNLTLLSRLKAEKQIFFSFFVWRYAVSDGFSWFLFLGLFTAFAMHLNYRIAARQCAAVLQVDPRGVLS